MEGVVGLRGMDLSFQNTSTITKQYLSHNPDTDKRNKLPSLDMDRKRDFHIIESYAIVTAEM